MTAVVPVRRPPVLRLVVGVVAVVGWLVATSVVGFAAVVAFPVTLAAAVLLVPLGTAYGVVIRTVLAVRRRRARLRGAPVTTPDEQRAARFESRAQRWDRVLGIVLLGTAVPAGLLAAARLLPGLENLPATEDGENILLRSSALLSAGIAAELLIAIPVAAVVVTVLAVRTPLLVGEAAALAAGSDAHRRIRVTRVLSWTAYCVYTAVGLAVIWWVLASRFFG